MLRYLIAAILCLSAYATVVAQVYVGSSGNSGLTIHVSDSVSRANLYGAYVMLVLGRDTMRMATDSRGEARFSTDRLRPDSIDVTVSYIGFETKKEKFPPDASRNYFTVRLTEKLHDLAEIVVSGDAVAVVMRGDTVRFIASAFKTFEDDPMSKLFEVIPGMRFENGSLIYLGEAIHRITIDHQRLFGDQVMLALENIRADDVIDIDVYKEASDWDKLNEVENPKLQTVANVRTKSKPAMIRNTTLMAAGGVAIDPDYGDKKQLLYDASGKLVYSRVGETVSADATRSDGPVATGRGYKEYEMTKGNLLYNRQEANKYSFLTDNTVTIIDKATESRSESEYFPTDKYTTRNYNVMNLSDKRYSHIWSRNKGGYIFTNKSQIGANLDIMYTGNLNKSANLISAVQDGIQIQSRNLRQREKDNSYSLRPEIYYYKKINSTTINITANADISENDGNGWRLDTLSSSTSQIHLDNESGGWSRNYGGRALVSFRLTPVISLSLSDYLSYIDSKTRRTSVDMLTGVTDLTNSYNYRIHELNNRSNVQLTYRDNSKKRGLTSVLTSISWEHKDMLRDNYFPKEYELPRAFDLINTSVLMEYKFSVFNKLDLNCTRGSSSMLSLLDFIDLDDSNPTMLRAGNPNLKLPVTSSLELTGTFIKGASTYEFRVGYDTEEKVIVEKSRYFTENTYLSEYDYTASEGSTLITKENRNGDRRLIIGGNYGVRSGKLQSNIKLGLNYIYGRTPAYVAEQPVMITDNSYRASLSIMGNFSSVFMPTLSSNTSYSDRDNGSVRIETFSQTLGLNVRLRIARSVELNSVNDFRWNIQWPDVPGMDRFGIVSNLSLGYLFGESRNFSLKVEVNDLFNKKQRVFVRTYDEYISTSYINSLGRYAMLRAEWKF